MGRSLLILVVMAAVIISSLAGAAKCSAEEVSTLLEAHFDSGTDGFVYQDDLFGTSHPGYASGSYGSSLGYSGGGVQVFLGGVDDQAIGGISGGWQYSFSLGAPQPGVSLSFRYLLQQTATYEYDEYSRVLVKVDGVQHGRGAKEYVDHVSGDGGGGEGNGPGNRNVFLPTTEWQQHEIYLGSLAAGQHTLVLGAFNNHKDAADESTVLFLDDVTLTSGNRAPGLTDAQILVNRVSLTEYKRHLEGVARRNDRCRLWECPANDYVDAIAWLEGELQALGYTTVQHASEADGRWTLNLWATRVGTVTPTQMYLVSAHLDGWGGGTAFDDDGSGVSAVLEAARVLAGADVTTDKSVRFLFLDREEMDSVGALNYVLDREPLQGTLDEPTWLGLIQLDSLLYDHGIGTPSADQSPYADLDVEWHAGTAKEVGAKALANRWRYANGTYSTDYPASAWNYSFATDDTRFWDYVPAISVRENRRILERDLDDGEWINFYHHTTKDIEASYSDADIRLGVNAVQATVGMLAEVAGAHVVGPSSPPEADALSVSTPEDTPVDITLTGADPDGDPITFRVVQGPGHGTLSGTAPDLTYTPAGNYNGLDSFVFVVNDGHVDSAPATIRIAISAVNDPPLAKGRAMLVLQDTAKSITLMGLDVDGDPLTYSIVTGPLHGTLSGTAPGLSYLPVVGYAGPDSLVFVVNDGMVDSAPAAINMLVGQVTDVLVCKGALPGIGTGWAVTCTVRSSAVTAFTDED